MSFFQRVLRGLPLPMPKTGDQLTLIRIPGPEIDTRPNQTTKGQLSSLLGWAAVAVRTIAADVQANEWGIFRQAGDEREELQEDEIPPLFIRATEFRTFGQLLEITTTHLDLTGTAYWHLLSDEPGGPVYGIDLIYPHWVVRPEFNDTSTAIDRWKVQIPGHSQKDIPAEDVIYFRYPHPMNPWAGASPVEQFALSHDLDLYARAYGSALLKNNAVPQIALTTDMPLNPDQADELAQRYVDKHNNQPGWPAVLSKGADIKKLGFSFRDLDFMSVARLSRDQIFAVYNFPGSKVGISEDVNRTDSEAHERSYEKNCLKPRLDRIQEPVNVQLIPRIEELNRGRVRHFFLFENPIQEDKDFILKKFSDGLEKGTLTVNEWRRSQGIDETEDGDVYLLSSTVRRVPSGNLNQSDEDRITNPSNRAKISNTLDPIRLQLGELEFLRAQDPQERTLKSKIRAQFSREQKRILKAFKEQERSVKRDWIDNELDGEEERWQEMIQQALRLGARRGWDLTNDELGLDVDFELFSNKASEWARRQSSEHVAEITKTTRDRVRRTIQRAIEEGETTDATAKKLRDLFDDFKGTRSETIARTETASSTNFGKEKGAEEIQRRLDIRLTKTWVTTRDGRERDSHNIAHGQTVPVDERFNVGGTFLKQPGDPTGPANEVIRCRCTTVYQEEEE